MKKSNHKDEQIAFTLKQVGTGTPVAEVIRRMGILHGSPLCFLVDDSLVSACTGRAADV